jgi:glycosyltransferase involved in cell wall biosynthesis
MNDATGALPRVTVVIPIHNEAALLPSALSAIVDSLSPVAADVDILLAENGSTDGTVGLAAELVASYSQLSMVRLPEPDHGAAMRTGLLTARGDWMVLFDIDYFSGEFVAAALDAALRADVVLASKRAEGASDQRSEFRRFATWTFNMILLMLFRSRVSDTHGMKAIRAEVVQALVPEVISTRDLFDTELVIRAERAGFRIVEVPANVEEIRVTSQSFLKRVPRTLLGLWRIRVRLWKEWLRDRRG